MDTASLGNFMKMLGSYKKLVSVGADVNAKSNFGKTPLHVAAENGYLKAVEILISAGANVNAKDKNGKIPLDIASNNTREAIKQYLTKQNLVTPKTHLP